MHSDQPYFPGNSTLPLGDHVDYYGHYSQNAPMRSVFNGLVPPGIKTRAPFPTVDIQPLNSCPRNFIIFDQTNDRSQIMFHPEININCSKLFHPGFIANTSIFPENVQHKDAINEEREEISSPLKEDSADIDALLSSEYEENEESDDEVSTARTGAVYECDSPDSCSNYEPRKKRPFFKKPCGALGNEKKRHQRMRKMVRALRGIVPGANRMSGAAVIDEAVRYLKSLRVEVQKLGVGNAKC